MLVTGGGGFIGSHLVESLVHAGASVTALAHYNGSGSTGWISKLPTKIQNELNPVMGDVTDSEFVADQISQQEIVFNLAALIAIPFSFKSPRLYFNTNVLGTMNVLEGAKKSGSRVIHMSTSEVYGTPENVPILETHAIKPQSPYAASKAAADNLCYSYSQSFDLDVTIIRPFNTYGPRQSTRAIIPTILSQLLAGHEFINVGSLEPVRDFTFVSDTVKALRLAGLQMGISGETIHLGTGESVSIGELLNYCKEIFNRSFEIQVQDQRKRPSRSEVMILHSDPAKAKNLLNWESEVSLKEGLITTSEWMKTQGSYLEKSGSYHV